MTNPNDPAYTNVGNATGLTKREVFAMAAMTGLLANPHEDNSAVVIKAAVLIADDLIQQLNKTA